MALFAHQQAALDRLDRLPGAALFLDLGTGKTRVLLEDLAKPDRAPAIVLTPSAVLDHWEAEAARWVPWIKFRTIRRRKDARILWPTDGIYAIGYDLAKILRPPPGGWRFRTVAADESTRLKNPYSDRTKAIRPMFQNAVYRRVASGFPAPEGVRDLWSQYDLVVPGLLGGSYEDFVAWASRTSGSSEIVHQRAAALTIRAMRRDVLPDLPPRTFEVRTVQPTRATEALARQVREEGRTPVMTYNQAQARVSKCLQLANGFHYAQDRTYVHADDAKAREILNIIDDQPPDERIVVWAYWLAHADLLQRYLAARTHRPITRDLQVYKDTPGSVLIATYNLAEGVSMVEGRLAIYASRPYAASQRAQSLDRMHRPGQRRKVHIVDVVSKLQEDLIYYRALVDKVSLAQAILEGRFGSVAA